MMTVAELAIEVNAPTQKAEENLKRTSTEVDKTGSAFGRLPGFIGGAVSSLVSFAGSLTLAFGGVQQIIGVVGGWVSSAEQATQNQNLLNAVLKSTNDAVGMSAAQINQMVQSLKSLTGVDDDVILQGTNMLLTFTNIGKNVFPQANQTMLDMAVAMNHGSLAGLDLKDTAIQLGKALNDPINGLSALSRVGVTFTQQQKDQIKALQDAGDMAGAQKIILDELAREFGGAAKAAGDADPFNRFKLAMGDIGKAIGGLVLPPLTALANFITPLANNFLNWVGTLNQTGGALDQVGRFLAPLGKDFQTLAQIWNTQVLPELQFLGHMIAVDVQPGLQSLWDLAEHLAAPFEQWGAALQNMLSPMAQMVARGSTMFGFFQPLNDFIYQATQGFDLLASILSGQVAKSFDSTLKDWGPIVQNLAGWFQNSMLPAIQAQMPVFESLVNLLVTQGIPAFFAIRDAISHIASVIISTVLPVFEKWWPILVKVGGFLLDLGRQALAFLIPKVEEAVKAISKFADEMSTRLGPFINRLANDIQVGAAIISKVWNLLWPTMSAVLKYAWDIISGVIRTLWDFISGAFKVGADLLSGNWSQLWTDLKNLLHGVVQDVKNIFIGMWNDLGGIVGTVWNSILLPFFTGLWNDVTGWFSGLINHLTNAWNNFWGGLTSNSYNAKNDVGSGSFSHGGRAGGGPVFAGGAYVVGENRRELFVPQQDGYIIPNKQTEKLLAGGKGGHTFNINGANVNYPQQLMSLLQREAALHPV